MMIVTEVGVRTACGATRRCSSGVEFAAALHGIHRSSVQGPTLSTAPSGHRYGSSGAGISHRFPVRQRENFLIRHPNLLSSCDRNFQQKEHSNLILESRGLLLEPCCFEVIDDIGNAPVGRVWQLTVLHWAVGSH